MYPTFQESAPRSVAYTFGALAVLLACHLPGTHAWSALALTWVAVSLAWVAIAYAARESRWLCKGERGQRPWFAALALAPYIGLCLLLVRLTSAMTKDSGPTRVSETLWISGRIGAQDIPAQVEVIVDLGSELPRISNLPTHIRYVHFPILDGGVPCPTRLLTLLHSLTPDVPVLVHCAQGNGRSMLIAASYLLSQGASWSATFNAIATRRPCSRLSRGQLRYLAQLHVCGFFRHRPSNERPLARLDYSTCSNAAGAVPGA